ncbi:MAG TPA: hypothetical protein VGL83_00885 [Stellaceae bacterium]|jgi:hypothetical protein
MASSKAGPTGFGIRVEGRDVGMTFATASDAHDSAARLAQPAFKSVIVFDRLSGKAVERRAPPRPAQIAIN